MKNKSSERVKGFLIGSIATFFVTTNITLFASNPIKNTIDAYFNTINIQVNGENLPTDNILYNGRTYVPLRSISEMLDKEVSWEESTRTANIIDRVDLDTLNSLESILNDLIILPEEGTYDAYEAQLMISRISKIPKKILSKLLLAEVEIWLSNTNVTGVPAFSHLSGVVPRGWDGTGLTWDDVPGAGGQTVVARIGYSTIGHGSYNLELHETAHAIDSYVFNDISYSDEFLNILNQEKYNLFGSNPYFDFPEEYFAETFAMFYLNEETNTLLKTKAPITYEFIRDLEFRL